MTGRALLKPRSRKSSTMRFSEPTKFALPCGCPSAVERGWSLLSPTEMATLWACSACKMPPFSRLMWLSPKRGMSITMRMGSTSIRGINSPASPREPRLLTARSASMPKPGFHRVWMAIRREPSPRSIIRLSIPSVGANLGDPQADTAYMDTVLGRNAFNPLHRSGSSGQHELLGRGHQPQQSKRDCVLPRKHPALSQRRVDRRVWRLRGRGRSG